ncbi:GntR family transcriptional regulator [Rhizobium puerariae]|uniref:GntR family transcriptional regulator n=1 Tax=Rhizobium puerariae TaxID=1585791 RepID=A0ABV6ADM4_9HYPH
MENSIVRVADLRQQVYTTLKERITSGAFPLDTKFQEINLAQDLGVSRTPVREALAMLVRDGLLVQAAKGFRFPDFTYDEIVDVIEIRLRLEPYAVERMIVENDGQSMKQLGARVKATLVGSADSSAYIEVHRRVRQDIYSHVRNRQLVAAINRYEDSVHFMRIRTLSYDPWRRISYEGMLKLADAIEACEPDMARSLMEQQLINARKAYQHYWKESLGFETATNQSI